MREPAWVRLGLDKDEWRECRTAAREMSLASGTRVSPHVVAVEFALARDFDDAAESSSLLSAPRRGGHGVRGAARR